MFRCRTDDSSRALEVPQWMFEVAMCCRSQLAPRAIVACRALYELRELIGATERIASTPVLQAEHLTPHTAGGAHATQDSKDLERAAAAIPTDGAAALEARTGRSSPAHDYATCTVAASARSGAGGAR